ncbi:ABC transporter permease [Paramicrobacterium fandaimingii]|uniref:ABC transporter permease n=1 Tax=Paramicrobacterium fandaimingii TaxID=2708079 RepID=UPI001FD3C118|nr:ABC transporter permease [Microbacterium fandaimingii]
MIATPILLLCLWQAASVSGLVDRRFWPAPTDIGVAFVENIESGVLISEAAISLRRILTGFACGTALGVVIGLLLGTVRTLRVAFYPIIGALYTVPKIAIIPLLLLLFGLGEAPKLVLISAGVFFIVVISCVAAVTGVSSSYLEPVRTFNASFMQRLCHVVIPAALPELFIAFRLAMGQAVLLTIGIEIIQSSDGLGFMIWNAWELYLTSLMYVGIVFVSLLGVVLQGSVTFVGNRIMPWRRTISNH